MIVAIIPVKSLTAAKSRLEAALDANQRRALVVTMFEKVASECVACVGINEICVVTRDPEITAIANQRRLPVIREHMDAGLNGSVSAGLNAARSLGAEHVLILPADIPRVDRSELQQILDASGGHQSIIVPCHKGSGTNALLIPAHVDFKPQFGEDSFRRHLDQLAALGLKARVLHLAGIAADVDEPADLAALSSESPSDWSFPMPTEAVASGDATWRRR